MNVPLPFCSWCEQESRPGGVQRQDSPAAWRASCFSACRPVVNKRALSSLPRGLLYFTRITKDRGRRAGQQNLSQFCVGYSLSKWGQRMWPQPRGIRMKSCFTERLSTFSSVFSYTLPALPGQIGVPSLLRSTIWLIWPKVSCALHSWARLCVFSR